MKRQILLFFLPVGLLFSCAGKGPFNHKNQAELQNAYYSSLYTSEALDIVNEMYYQAIFWVHVDKIDETPSKLKFEANQDSILPGLLNALSELSMDWSDQDKNSLEEIKLMTDTLFSYYTYIKDQLSTFVSYEDPFVVFEVTPMVEYNGNVCRYNKEIQDKIRLMNEHFKNKLSAYIEPIEMAD